LTTRSISRTAQGGSTPASPASSNERRPARLVTSIVSNWGAFAFAAIVNFFLSPFVVHQLGDTSYGLWALLGSLVGYLGLLDLGVRSAVTRFVAAASARSDHTEASRYASAAGGLFALAAGMVIAVSLGLASVLGRLFAIPPELVPVARLVMVLAGTAVAVSLVGGVFGGIVVARERFATLNAVEMGAEALRAVAVVAALSAGAGLAGLAAIQLGTSALRTAATAITARKVYPALRIRPTFVHRDERRAILRFGITSTALNVAGMLAFYTDSIVIGAALPVAMVTPFAIGSGLTAYARALVSGVSHVVTPRTSSLEGSGGQAAIGPLVLSMGRVASLVVMPMTITFIIRGGSFIGLWMGPAYASPAGRVLWILAIALSFAAARHVASASLIGLNRHAGLIPATAAEGVANLGLSILFVGPWSIWGVAWGTTIPNLAVSLLFMPWFLNRHLGLGTAAIYRDFWVRPIVAMLPYAAATSLVEALWPAVSLIIFFTQVGLLLPIAAVGAWLVALTENERRALIRGTARAD
jgi:O-antigen/teichoic acid export membrane protein